MSGPQAGTITAAINGPDHTSRYDAITVEAVGAVWPSHATFAWSIAPAQGVTHHQEKHQLRVSFEEEGRYTVRVRVLDKAKREVASTPDHNVDVGVPAAGGNSDEEYWQEQMVTGTREALTTVRQSAATWQGMTAGVIGLFGVVTLLGSPSLEAARVPWLAWSAFGLVAVAFAAALAGVWVLARILASGVKVGELVSAEEFAKRTTEAAVSASGRLRLSKVFTFVAAGLVAAAGLLLAAGNLLGGDVPVQHVLVRTETETLCGVLGAADGGAVSVAGEEIGATLSVQVVDSC